jgi:DNA polymerase-3 subunit delta
MEEKLGDPTTADMNITRFEGGGFDVEDLRAAAAAMPFLAPRRLVVVDNISKKYTRKEQYSKLIEMMDGLPPTTALVLAEKSPLKDSHWLMKWAKTAGDRAYVRAFNVPKGAQMANWIRAYAGEKGGEISHQAAALLAENVQDVPRMAALEVDKLLAFVNYARPVDVDDVEMAAAFVGGQGDYFAFMDSIAARNGRKAMDMLQKLLDEQDPLPLFFSLVGHFRLVLQAREIYENGGTDQTVAKTLGIHPFRAKKMTVQARTMPLQSLENMYLHLQRLDLEIKTGQIDPALALESMVAELTTV